MSGSGTTIAQGGLTLGGTAANTTYQEGLATRTLDNYSTATLAGTYNNSGLYLYSGATLDNEAGASFDIADNTPIWANGGSPAGGTIANQGTFAKTAGAGTSVISAYDGNGGAVVFNQSGAGTVTAQSGTLELSGGGAMGGTGLLTAAAGADAGLRRWDLRRRRDFRHSGGRLGQLRRRPGQRPRLVQHHRVRRPPPAARPTSSVPSPTWVRPSWPAPARSTSPAP